MTQISSNKTLRSKQTPLLVPLVLGGSLIVQVLTLGVVAVQGFTIRRLYDKPAPSLVQTSNGQALRVRPVPATERTDATLTAFTASILPQIFNWQGTIPGPDGEEIPDPGIKVPASSGQKKVTTATASASLALAEDFRLSFLAKTAELTPPGVFTGDAQVVLVIDQVSTPEELEPGKWRVDVLAHLSVFDADNNPRETIPFNREIVLEATTAPLVPEGESLLEQAVYTIRQAGLQITDIRPIDR